MKKIANLFLILFLLTAGIGILDELLTQLAAAAPLTGLRDLGDFLCLLFGLIVYLSFGFNQQLPKLIFVPLLASLLWGLLDFWPGETLAGEHYRLYAASGQLLLGLLLLRLNRQRNQQSWLLVPSQLGDNNFSGRRLLRFILITLALFPIAILLLSFATTSSLIEEHTAGFVRLKPNGLYMLEKVYAQNGKQVRLTSMIHLAQQEYYAELRDSLQGKPLLLLAEGVSDHGGRLQGQFGYAKIAAMIGLAAQDSMTFPGRVITAESLDQPAAISATGADILRADIDLKEFDAHSIAVLNALGKYLLNSTSLTDGYAQFSRWAQENMTEDSNQILMADLLEKRNAAVLSYLPKALQKYDTLLIPWGALHMPGLEIALQQQGFSLQSSQQRLSIDFLRLPYQQLWGNLFAEARD